MFKISYKAIIKYLLVLSLVVFSMIFTSRSINVSAAKDDGDDWVHYIGVSTGRVNVRTGPGEEFDKITDSNGKPVQVQAQDEVLIIGEKENAAGKIWYNIRFTSNGVEYEGFSTSSYISKDEERVITPTPTPTPAPTATPIPTPTEAITEAPTPTQQLLIEDNQPANSKEKILFVMIVVICVAILFLIIFIIIKLVRDSKRKNGNNASRKVDKLKKLHIEGQETGKKVPQIKRIADTPLEEEVRKDVYYKKSYDYNADFAGKASASKESDEKKELRAAIDRLQEHDIVYHVIYGEGEVRDNSDVNLLEVRFGNDMRFLKKEQLVARKELQIADEEEQAIAKKRRKRQQR